VAVGAEPVVVIAAAEIRAKAEADNAHNRFVSNLNNRFASNLNNRFASNLNNRFASSPNNPFANSRSRIAPTPVKARVSHNLTVLIPLEVQVKARVRASRNPTVRVLAPNNPSVPLLSVSAQVRMEERLIHTPCTSVFIPALAGNTLRSSAQFSNGNGITFAKSRALLKTRTETSIR
jgi:hypothetical protein